MNLKSVKLLLLSAALAAVMTACGGGGEGSARARGGEPSQALQLVSRHIGEAALSVQLGHHRLGAHTHSDAVLLPMVPSGGLGCVRLAGQRR